MKILALSEGEGGSNFYRLAEPARIARTLGVDITIDTSVDGDVSYNRTTKLSHVHELFTDADLIIVQRPLRQIWTPLLEQAKKQGIATIVELDDDYETVHRDNVASRNFDETSLDHPRWVRSACEVADFVSVSTPALEKYARHKRSVVLRNCVPEEYLSVKPTRELDTPVIGWSGSVAVHPNDLQTTRGAVADIVHANDIPFGVVGDGKSVRNYLGLKTSVPVGITGWVPMEFYTQAMANTFNIGIVPLEQSPFNQAKSALKGLEMAALGIPFVASPTREYERLEAYGVGKTARTPGEWRKHLQRMIDRPEETVKLSKQYQETIYNEMTYERNGHLWVEAWERAIQYRKKHHG